MTQPSAKAKKNSPKKSNKKQPESRAKSGARRLVGVSLWGLLFKLILVGLVLCAALIVYLDALVTDKFEGKRWSLPAKVYARPLEIYPGAALKLNNLLHELELLGYRRSTSIAQPGSYQQEGEQVRLHTRSFQLWDEALAARQVAIRISDDLVIDLQSGGQSLPLMSLEPMLIGGIYPKHGEDRTLVRIDEVPNFILETLITVEDRDFYSHHGVSPVAIARAMWVNLRSGQVKQGGSTLTQQLVKNFYLTSDRTVTRKATEAIMAILLDLHYDKSEILEAYLNEVYLGQAGRRAIHGFGLGSHYYFGRGLKELKLHQAALLVSLVKGPSYYNPRRHPERALARRNLVLDMLAQAGKVSPEQADWAKRQPLDVAQQSSYTDVSYPAYMDLVKRQLRRDYKAEDLTSEGLRIFTSLDPLVQREAEQSLAKQINRFRRQDVARMRQLEGALVVTSTDTGEVLALVGGKDTKYSGFNRALDAVRPVGSLLKPALYLTALAQPQKYTLVSPLDDGPISVPAEGGKLWTPKNSDRQSHGVIPLHRALSQSYNQASTRLAMEVGVEQVITTIRQLGVQRKLPPYPSIILGARGLTPIEVAAMYQTIAAGGFNTPLRAIRDVTTSEGKPLNRYPLHVEQRFDPGVIHLLYYVLQETMREGTGRAVYNQVPASLNVAGKTGTTDDLRDSWFAGFTGDRLAVVWLGNDDNTPTGLTGSRGALSVWGQLMQGLAPASFTGTLPENVQYLWVDDSSGMRSEADCLGARYMPFIKGSEPQRTAECHRQPGRLGEWIKSWFE
ncbi:MAG: penicillin-binding protein 1B [Pseudomonadales bacterium]